MLLETIAFMLLGVIVGTATGLLPGLHPNAVFALVLSSAAFLSGFPALCTMVFIISLSISNIFWTSYLPYCLGRQTPTVALLSFQVTRCSWKGGDMKQSCFQWQEE